MVTHRRFSHAVLDKIEIKDGVAEGLYREPIDALFGMTAFEYGTLVGGGGGNRTRVLRHITRASPGASCFAFLSPGGPAGRPPTGSVAVCCPAHPRDRAERWILLTDARHRAGGTPGLTTSNSRQAARARLVRVTLALIVCGHRINEVMSAILGPLPLDQPLKSKPVTPC